MFFSESYKGEIQLIASSPSTLVYCTLHNNAVVLKLSVNRVKLLHFHNNENRGPISDGSMHRVKSEICLVYIIPWHFMVVPFTSSVLHMSIVR